MVSGLIPITMQECEVIDCKYEYHGPANNVVNFWKLSYQGGGMSIVDELNKLITGQ
jgi:hypothetical protein